MWLSTYDVRKAKVLSPTRSRPADWLHSALRFSGQHGAGVVIGEADLQYE